MEYKFPRITATLIPLERIPKHLEHEGLTLSDPQRELLRDSAKGLMLKNQLINGIVTDAHLRFYMQNGELHHRLELKKPTLEIPNEVDGQVLTPEQKDQLKAEKLVFISGKSGKFFIQIDKRLNKVVVKTPEQLQIPKEIGGYVLTDQDKQLFANKESLPLRIYQNPETKNYFAAVLKVTQDGTGYEFDDKYYKSIPKEKAAELIEKLNKQQTLIADASSLLKETGATIIKQEPLKTRTEEKHEIFEKHVQDRNFSAIKNMTDSGFTVSSTHVENLTKKFQYTKEEKSQLSSCTKTKVSQSKEFGL